jgi:hypothetical protein
MSDSIPVYVHYPSGSVRIEGELALVEPRPADQLGEAVALLLFASGWLERRKDRVELLDDGWVRRETSVDCVIPGSLEPLGESEAGAPRYVLPIALLPKIPPVLMRFGFDAGDGPLPVPRRGQNGLGAYAALLYAAGAALESEPRELPKELREELLFVALGPPEYADPFAQRLRAPRRGLPEIPDVEGLAPLDSAEVELDAWAAQLASREQGRLVVGGGSVSDDVLVDLNQKLARDPLTSWLLKAFAASSVVIVQVDAAETRHKFLRLSYDSRIFKDEQRIGEKVGMTLGWESINLGIETPYVGAHSYHFEFLGTDGIEVIESKLLTEPEASAGGSGPDGVDDSSSHPNSLFAEGDRGRVHHYLDNATGVDRVTAFVRLRLAAENFVAPAYLTAWGVALTILACGGLAQPLVRHGGGALPLLLVFPGLAATIVASTLRHPLVAQVLRRARLALIASALLSFMTASVLPLIHTGQMANAAGWVRGVWLSLGALALLPVGLLYLARKLPRSMLDEGRLERGSLWFQRQVQEAARRGARRRQRRLRLTISSPGMTWDQARASSLRSVSRRRFSVTPGRRRRFRDDLPYLLLRVEPEPKLTSSTAQGLRRATAAFKRWLWIGSRWLARFRATTRTPLRTNARPTDVFLNQPLEMRRQLSATALWLSDRLPQGYVFEASWPRSLLVRLVALARRRWATRATDDPVECSAEQLAVALRAGEAHLNRSYRVSPSDGEEDLAA